MPPLPPQPATPSIATRARSASLAAPLRSGPLELEDDDRVQRPEDAEEDGPPGQVPLHQRAAPERAAASADAERTGEAGVLAGVQKHQEDQDHRDDDLDHAEHGCHARQCRDQFQHLTGRSYRSALALSRRSSFLRMSTASPRSSRSSRLKSSSESLPEA